MKSRGWERKLGGEKGVKIKYRGRERREAQRDRTMKKKMRWGLGGRRGNLETSRKSQGSVV